MNFKKLSFSFLILLVTSVAISGCICNAPVNENKPVITATTTTHGTGQYIDGNELFNMSEVTMMAYNVQFMKKGDSKTVAHSTNVIMEFQNETYKDTEARYVKMLIEPYPANMTFEYKYDISTNNILWAHVSGNFSGIKIDAEIPVDQFSSRASEYGIKDPVIITSSKRLELMRTESIEVPLGNFDNVKVYEYDSSDSNLKVWKSDELPLPLKIISTDKIDGSSTTLELMGYIIYY